jgi:hypothetical protein
VNEQELAHRAEQALLGGLLAGGDPGIVAQVRAGDFSDPRHQAIYLALAGTTERADGQVGWPRGRLGRAARQQARDMMPYLDQLAATCPEREHLTSYAAMITHARADRGATGQPGTGRQRESADDQLASAGAWLSANGARGRRAAGSPAAAVGTDPLQNPELAGLARALRPAVQARAEAGRAALSARPTDNPAGGQERGAQAGINRESLQRNVLADLMRHPADGRAAVVRIPADMFTAGPLRQLYEMISARIATGRPVDPLIIAWDARQHDETAATATGTAARWTLSAIALRIGSTPTVRGTTRVFGRALLADHLLTGRFGSRWTQDPEVAARLGVPGRAGRAAGSAAAAGHGQATEHPAARDPAPAGPSSDPVRGPVARASAASAPGHAAGRGRGRPGPGPGPGPAEPGNGAAPSR